MQPDFISVFLLTINLTYMKNNLFLMTTVIAIVVLFLGCKKDQYTISVGVNAPEMGIVTGGGKYDVNTAITLSAIPKNGYVFVKWDDGNTDNPRNIVVTQDAIRTAIFDEGGVTVTFQNKSWKAADIINTNSPSSNYLQLEIHKTANDDNDIFLLGTITKEVGKHTFESSQGDYFTYIDPNQTWVDEEGVIIDQNGAAHPGTKYYVWQVAENSFVEKITAIDINAKTIDAEWSENLFSIYDYIEHNGTPSTYYPLTCKMRKASWEWGTATKEIEPVNAKTGLLSVN